LLVTPLIVTFFAEPINMPWPHSPAAAYGHVVRVDTDDVIMGSAVRNHAQLGIRLHDQSDWFANGDPARLDQIGTAWDLKRFTRLAAVKSREDRVGGEYACHNKFATGHPSKDDWKTLPGG
jgi:hypothetical protein